VHTTQDQATTIAILGHGEDVTLHNFENRLYLELCRQYNHVEMFISSKAGELSRRINALARTADRLIQNLAAKHSSSQVFRRQRRAAKCERRLLRVGDEIQNLIRFAHAQIVAVRKILRKYKKWTSSTALGSRFNEDMLRNSKFSTRRDFNTLQKRFDEILQILRDALPSLSEPSSRSSDEQTPGSGTTVQKFELLQYLLQEHMQVHLRLSRQSRSRIGTNTTMEARWVVRKMRTQSTSTPIRYLSSPGSDTFTPSSAFLSKRLSIGSASTHSSVSLSSTTDLIRNTATSPPPPTRMRKATPYPPEFPARGFVGHYAFPSISKPNVQLYRENVLFWVTVGCYAISFALLSISSILTWTGRHKLRIEVDSAVTVGVACSLLSACSALGATLCRRDSLTISYQVMVGNIFIACCLLNGTRLVLVVGNAP